MVRTMDCRSEAPWSRASVWVELSAREYSDDHDDVEWPEDTLPEQDGVLTRSYRLVGFAAEQGAVAAGGCGGEHVAGAGGETSGKSALGDFIKASAAEATGRKACSELPASNQSRWAAFS